MALRIAPWIAQEVQAALQSKAGGSVPPSRGLEFPAEQSQERTLYVHPRDPRTLIEVTMDGNDLIRICARHQWAAPSVTRFDLLGECPSCLAEIDGLEGRRRYAALHAVNVRIVGTV